MGHNPNIPYTWWFEIFVCFHSCFGEDFQFDEYFSDGLKPTTSFFLLFFVLRIQHVWLEQNGFKCWYTKRFCMFSGDCLMDSIMVKITITPAIWGMFYFFVPTTRYLEFFWMEKNKNTWLFRTDGNHWTDILLGEGTLKDSMVVERGNERRMKMVLWFICCSCYTFDLHNNYLRLKLTFTPPTSMILESKQPLGDVYPIKQMEIFQFSHFCFQKTWCFCWNFW